MKQTRFACVNYARIRFWNKPVLSNECKVSCSMNQPAFDELKTDS